MATVFSTLTSWFNALAGFPIRKTALLVPEGMGLVPACLLETSFSVANGDEKVTKWMKLSFSTVSIHFKETLIRIENN